LQMINTIEIENFQNIRHASMDLDPGINIFIGESDQGKSAIVKGLYWLFFNRPSGDAFVRDVSPNKKASRCSCSVTLDNGTKIERYKERSENAYLIGQKKKKALRSDVPEEVLEALPLSETNIQAQFTPFFLLSLSPGQRAKLLNSAVGLDQIDRSLGCVNSLQRAAVKEKNRLEQSVEEKKEELSSYAWVDEAIEAIDRLCKLYDRDSQLAEDRDFLRHVLERIQELNATLDIDIKPTLDAADDISILSDKAQEFKQQEKDYHYLNGRVDFLRIQEEELENALEILEAQGDIEKLNEYISRFKRLETESDYLTSLTERMARSAKQLKLAQRDKKKAEERYDNLMEGYKQCPLCGSHLNEN